MTGRDELQFYFWSQIPITLSSARVKAMPLSLYSSLLPLRLVGGPNAFVIRASVEPMPSPSAVLNLHAFSSAFTTAVSTLFGFPQDIAEMICRSLATISMPNDLYI